MSLVVFGSLNMDLVAGVPNLPSPGQTMAGHGFFTASGGKGANQAVACARLGASVSLLGRVGDDVFGLELHKNLAGLGVNVSGVLTTPGPSGVAIILVDQHAENSIVILPGANGQLGAADLARLEACLVSANTLLLQLEIPLPIVIAAARLAHARRVRVILDPAPAAPLPPELLSLVSILTPNETECAALVGFEIPTPALAEKAATCLLGSGVRQICIKMGAKGAFLHDGVSGGMVPAFAVKAIDTTAAGDVFNGALAVALEEGQPLRTAVRFANAAAALSVTRRGAQPSIPTRSEVENFLQARDAHE